MQIVFSTSVAGERFHFSRGQLVDLEPALAKQFIKEGTAQAYEPGEPTKTILRGGRVAETTARNAPRERR